MRRLAAPLQVTGVDEMTRHEAANVNCSVPEVIVLSEYVPSELANHDPVTSRDPVTGADVQPRVKRDRSSSPVTFRHEDVAVQVPTMLPPHAVPLEQEATTFPLLLLEPKVPELDCALAPDPPEPALPLEPAAPLLLFPLEPNAAPDPPVLEHAAKTTASTRRMFLMFMTAPGEMSAGPLVRATIQNRSGTLRLNPLRKTRLLELERLTPS